MVVKSEAVGSLLAAVSVGVGGLLGGVPTVGFSVV